MSFSFGPGIVKDGLILCVDAANRQSYVSGSSSWKDLAQYGQSGSLLNGPTFNSDNSGAIVFDGLDDQVSFQPTQIINNLAQRAFTAAAWIYPVSYGIFAGTARIIEKRAVDIPGSWNGFLFFVNSATNSIRAQILQPGSIDAQSTGLGDTTLLGKWSYVAMTCNYQTDKTIRLYINGIEVIYSQQTPGTGIPGDDSINDTGTLRIGMNEIANGRGFDGRVAQAHIYNRVLSSNELLNNYNVHKHRYGLT